MRLVGAACVFFAFAEAGGAGGHVLDSDMKPP